MAVVETDRAGTAGLYDSTTVRGWDVETVPTNPPRSERSMLDPPCLFMAIDPAPMRTEIVVGYPGPNCVFLGAASCSFEVAAFVPTVGNLLTRVRAVMPSVANHDVYVFIEGNNRVLWETLGEAVVRANPLGGGAIVLLSPSTTVTTAAAKRQYTETFRRDRDHFHFHPDFVGLDAGALAAMRAATSSTADDPHFENAFVPSMAFSVVTCERAPWSAPA